MIERVLAAAALIICIAMLVRLAAGERRRRQLDAGLRHLAWRARAAWYAVRYWRSSRQHAAKAAEEAIRRARGSTPRDGNVYRPSSFRKPRKPH